MDGDHEARLDGHRCPKASRRFLLGALGSVLPLALPGAGSAKKHHKKNPKRREQLAASCAPQGLSVNNDPSFSWAQTFVAQRTGVLTRAVFTLLQVDVDGADGQNSIEVDLLAVDESGMPINQLVLATRTVRVPQIVPPDTYLLDVRFPGRIVVAAKQRYALALFGGWELVPDNRVGDACAGGTAFREVGNHWTLINADLRFHVYVTS
jgi:hypothetical protein